MSADAATREQLAVTAALLDRGHSVHRTAAMFLLSTPALLILLGIAGAGRPATGAVLILAAAMLAGLAEWYLSIRVAFDAALFRRLAAQADDGGPDLPSLDAALVGLGLMPAAKAGRPLGARIAGARRLLTRQVAAAFLQALLVLSASGLAMLR